MQIPIMESFTLQLGSRMLHGRGNKMHCPEKIKYPLFEALKVLCQNEPPYYIKDIKSLKDLDEEQFIKLQDWASLNAKPEWSTGLSILECAEKIVKDAIDNGNIE